MRRSRSHARKLPGCRMVLLAVLLPGLPFLLAACGGDEPEPKATAEGAAGKGTTGDSATEEGATETGELLKNRDSLLPPEEQARSPVPGGIITLPAVTDPGTLNNLVRTTRLEDTLCLYIYPRLLHIEWDTLELIPFTAAALPEVSEDKLVYTWRLRAGLKWEDFEERGAYVTSRDVKFSFDLMKDPAVGAGHVAAELDNLKEIRVVDDHTFQAVYDRPRADAVYRFGHDFRMLPAHILEDVPHSGMARHPIGRAPLGYGPFRLHHWKTGEEILVVRSELNLDVFPRPFRPYVDGIRYRIIRDTGMWMTHFMREEIDLVGLQPDDWHFKTGNPDFERIATKHTYYLPFWFYIAWNNEQPLFSDARTRRALTHMTRREEILHSHIHGLGQVLSGPFYRFSRAYDPTIEPLPFDPAAASRLLEAAGWADRDGDGILDREVNGKRVSFEFEILKTTARLGYQEALLAAMKEDLRGLGIVMEIRPLEFSTLLKKLRDRDFDAFMLAYVAYPIFEDPYGKWHSSQIGGEKYNRAGYRNPEVDALLEKARLEFDDEKRYAMLRRIHAIIHEDQPFTFLYSLASLVAINRRWRNVGIHKTGVNFYEWWLPPDRRKASDEVPR